MIRSTLVYKGNCFWQGTFATEGKGVDCIESRISNKIIEEINAKIQLVKKE